MDTQQLKLLASRIGDLLAQNHHPIKHGQALDFVAAIPGLRNWPEVIAFPDRVAGSELSEVAGQRLARRIAEKVGVTFDTKALIAELAKAAPSESVPRLALWPDGPAPGIYVTTSQAAIDAAIRRYDEATAGEPIYAEQAGIKADGAIELGEYGIFSNGLSRVPSGILIVVGPVEMTQESWSNNRDRLSVASRLAIEARHRIAILFETPMAENLRNDVALLLQEAGADQIELDECLRGVVSEEGWLLETAPFVPPRAAPLAAGVTPIVDLPNELAQTLKDGVSMRPYGLVIVGSNGEKLARAELLDATLPLTEHAGPAARIQPDFRGGYDGDDPQSNRFAGVPVLPSIESAYASGYRRMILETVLSADEVALKHADDVCFHIGTFGTQVADALLRAANPNLMDRPEIIEKTIAILCHAEIETKQGTYTMCDAIPAQQACPATGGFEQISEFLDARRTVRWEDQLEVLLAKGLVTVAQIKKEFRGHDLNGFLKARKKRTVTA